MNLFSIETEAASPAGQTRRFWIQLSDLNWWLVFLIYTFAALLTADTVYTSDLAERVHPVFSRPLIAELTGHYTALLLLPLMVVGFGRLPITRGNWFWSIPVHLTISVLLGVIHTLLMRFTREHLYAALGLGAYDYGQMSYRFLMEYHKQFLHYWIVFLVLRALVHLRQGREHERQAAALRLKTSELERQLAEVQLGALRSQLNPHFLFNTLNMISSVMYDDPDRADHMLATLSRMLRLSLEENIEALVPLRRELEFVDCLAELVRARFENRAAITVTADPELLDAPVPNLVLHTLVENAIKHHAGAADPVVAVEATVTSKGSSMEIEVTDNGPGLADTDQAIGRGVGLKNLKTRLEALYGNNYSMRLQNRPKGGLQALLSFPLAQTPSASAARTAAVLV